MTKIEEFAREHGGLKEATVTDVCYRDAFEVETINLKNCTINEALKVIYCAVANAWELAHEQIIEYVECCIYANDGAHMSDTWDECPQL